MTIIHQTGVSSPFVFAGTGDEYQVAGIITNQGSTTSAVILSNEVGNTITNAGLIASFGAGDAITMIGGGTITNTGGIGGAISATSTLTFTNAVKGRITGFVVDNTGDFLTGSVITNRGVMIFAEEVGNTPHLANAVIELGAGGRHGRQQRQDHR